MGNPTMDPLYAEQYRTRATHLYQAKGWMLKGMTTPESRIEGKKAYWPRIGLGEANEKKPNKAATPMNAKGDQVSADLKTFEAFENIEKFDVSRINFNEREAQVKTGVMALGRARDFACIDAISAAATKTGTTLFYNQSTNAFNLEHAANMEALLADQLEGAMTEVFLGVPPRYWTNLTMFKQFTSADYIGPDLPFLRKMQAKTWNGIHFVRWPKSYAERTKPDASANYDVFMFDKSAVGYANSYDIDDYWTWDNKFGRWDLRLESEGANVVIQAPGIITGRFAQGTAESFN